MNFAGLLISIVIPTFNKWELTRDCLEAIRASTREGMYEIIVVDNASTDITPDELRRREAAGELRAILNPQNMGFGHACNQGAKAARAPHIVFLNNAIHDGGVIIRGDRDVPAVEIQKVMALIAASGIDDISFSALNQE